MAALFDEPQSESAYFLDAESAAETARLMLQDKIINEAMGKIFPEKTDLSAVERILDIACGPGGWVLEAARLYPNIDILGIDNSETSILYARAQAKVQKLANAAFKTMDILESLDLPDEAIDIVNARDLVGVLTPESWPRFLSEAYRVCRPGGRIYLTEYESPITSSPALTRLFRRLAQAFQLKGRSFSACGAQLGITARLPGLLRQVGCREIQQLAYVIDLSPDSEAYDAVYKNYEVFMQLARPFLLDSGVLEAEEFDHLYQQMLVEMLAEDFCGVWYFLTAWGTR